MLSAFFKLQYRWCYNYFNFFKKMILVEYRDKQWLHTEEEYINIMTSHRRYGYNQRAYKVDFSMKDKYKRTLDIGKPFVHEKAGATRTLEEWVEKCKKYKLDKGRDDLTIAASIVKSANTTVGWEKIN
jgi:hypothetical protein